MEDAPNLERRLLIHLILDLAINISCTLFNIKGISLSTAFGAHYHVASLVFVAFKSCRVILELKVPKLLLLDTLRICLKDFKQILAFFDLSVCIGMDNLSKILHQPEISSHRIS